MRIAPWIAVLAGLSACGLEQVTVTLEGDVTVPGAHMNGAVFVPDVKVIGIQGLRFADAPELTAREVGAAEIDRVRLESLTLTPAGDDDLDVIDYVELFLHAPGEPEVPVAEKHVPDGASRLDLDVFDDDLAPYARAAGMSLRAAFQLRRPPASDLTLHVKARFRVDVTASAL